MGVDRIGYPTGLDLPGVISDCVSKAILDATIFPLQISTEFSYYVNPE